ncbi:hypothetical protein B0O95_1014 [Mycetohabitans endofungorum]|uniref:Uncharacterized protein n=1 Tax=Mycetohabitans endofungorum TaxID=417203 RepID=A0A2P5KDY8_9BURK|nr:hypothetical protein B0O95_1014 [Mycetohabitans endofungorum]
MTSAPTRWTAAELAEDAATSASQFRAERLAVSDAWEAHYTQARGNEDERAQRPHFRFPFG